MKKLSIGARIKAIRESRGMTQEEVAFEMNRSLPTYQRIERDITKVTFVQLEAIAKILKSSVIEIINYGSNQTSEIETYKKLLEEKERELRTKDMEIIDLQKKLLKTFQKRQK